MHRREFAGRVMDRLGLGLRRLARAVPEAGLRTIRGFGDWRTGKSPYANWPAYDVLRRPSAA